MVFLSLWEFIEPPWQLGLLLILPSLIFWRIGLKAYRGTYDRRKTYTRTGVLLPILLVLSLFYTLFLSVAGTSEVYHDIQYYPRVYTKVCEEYGAKAIFPPQIPLEAKKIEFLYSPLLLQRGEVFELSYTTTSEELQGWIQRLEQEAQWIGPDGQWRKAHGFGGDLEIAHYTRYHLYWDGNPQGEISYVLIDSDTRRILFHWSFAA